MRAVQGLVGLVGFLVLGACFDSRAREGCLHEGRYYASGAVITAWSCSDGPGGGSSVTSYCDDGTVISTITDWSGPAVDAAGLDAGRPCMRIIRE